jgi:hypothetical protein
MGVTDILCTNIYNCAQGTASVNSSVRLVVDGCEV